MIAASARRRRPDRLRSRYVPAVSSGVPRVAQAILAISVVGATTVAAEPWQVAVEGGLEVDTNVSRVETGGDSEGWPRTAPLFRALFELGRRGQVGEHLRWRGRGRLGARGVVAGEVESENIVTVAAELAVERDGPADTTIVARASHYDARALAAGPERRDFTTSGLDLGLRLPTEDDRRARFGVGLRRLAFRRDPALDWSGALLEVELSDQVWRCHDDRALDVTAHYQVERRGYAGLAFTRVACPDGALGVCVRPTDQARADLRHTADLELLYTGPQVLSARYRLIINDSSSFGSSLYRHRLDLAATVSLSAKVFATATLTGQLDQFPEPYLARVDDLDQPVDSIDDENRSGIAVRIARQLSSHWQVEARVAAFTDLLPRAGRSFSREVLYLGLTWDHDGGE